MLARWAVFVLVEACYQPQRHCRCLERFLTHLSSARFVRLVRELQHGLGQFAEFLSEDGERVKRVSWPCWIFGNCNRKFYSYFLDHGHAAFPPM